MAQCLEGGKGWFGIFPNTHPGQIGSLDGIFTSGKLVVFSLARLRASLDGCPKRRWAVL